MEEYKTNQHYNFASGLPIDYYEKNISNSRTGIDNTLIEINRLLKGIIGAEDPNKKAVEFVDYVLKEGENLLPGIITYYVDRFKCLPTSIQEYALSNTRKTNNYFRDDSGSDKVSFFANTEEYRTKSSSVASQNNQDPIIPVSEHIKNKISPKALSNTVALSNLTDKMSKRSQATPVAQSTYNTISKSTHNNYRTVTPTTNHLEAAKSAKQEIEADSYKKFEDCYRVKREYTFKSNPYNSKHRQDNPSEFIIDKNDDIAASGKSVVYTNSGNIPLKNKLRVEDLFEIMPPTREDTNKHSKTEEEEKSPVLGSAGTDTNILNEKGGKRPTKTYSSKEHKN